MNPIIKIITQRSLQIALPIIAVWMALQKPSTRSVRARVLGGILLSAGMSLYFATIFVGSVRFGFPRLMTRLPKARRLNSVALTFDDGPDPVTTPQILDILCTYDAKATFFLLVEQSAKFPELTRRIAAEGHSIGLHGITHDPLALNSTDQIVHLIRLAKRDLGSDCPEIRFFRPPFGFKSRSIQRACDHMGLTLVTWSVNPKDYKSGDAAEITQRIMRRIQGGDIVLLHEKRAETLAALPEILRRLAGRGLRSVRL